MSTASRRTRKNRPDGNPAGPRSARHPRGSSPQGPDRAQDDTRRAGNDARREDVRRGDVRREKAAAARAAEAARAQRRQRVIVGSVVVAVLAVAAVIGFAVQSSRTGSTPVVLPVTATGTDNGIVVGKADAPVTVDFYEDFQCPICEELETSLGPSVQQLIDDGRIKAVYHMMSFLGPESVRAANAAAAAAQEGKFKEYHAILYTNQPPERTSGYRNNTLTEFGTRVGLTSPAFTDAVNNGTYNGYVAKVEDDASKRGVTGTPTVFVNGRRLAPQSLTPQGFTAAVNNAAGTPAPAPSG
ncbi:DsbA family protein [Candidatus Protofrankia californiensis]|uniref:DsbA family protein n=1 Tax=Candidatus Protofrankia californiensis TaxID=1839754 RepID=UPI001041A69C|nr:thioredoxin domain-containing protein [Candidatus Protofrankia californiensis]